MSVDSIPTPPLLKLRERLLDVRRGLHYALRPPHFILVVGMHRSGTSCVTKTLNLLGVSFGRTIVDQEAPDNGEIHWESPTAIWINNEILSRSGGTWMDPPPVLRPSRRDLLRCQRFLWEFAGCRLATFKDPRLVLTYPVWNLILPEHTVIVCFRHPSSVARSLKKRDGLSLDRGIDLWRKYNRRLLEHFGDDRRALWFDFDRGKLAVEALVHQVTQRFALELRAEALSHYDPDAHHHRDETILRAEVLDLHATLQLRAIASGSEAPA